MLNLSTRLLVMLFALTLLAAGCAKKPVYEEAAAVDATSTTPEVSVMEEEQQPAAIVEEQVDEAAIARENARIAAANAATGLVRIHFEFDQYVLTDAAKSTLANNAALLKAAPSVKVKIEGHCDERGSDEYNLALGDKRALATKNYLVSLGVAASRLSIISYGEEMPLDSAMTEDAWAKNRRAEFRVQR